MKIIGVTGGIGSGKSMICKLFQCMGYPIFIADDVAKHIGSTENVQTQIKAAFGASICNTDGAIDKLLLGQLVFNNKDALTTLNDIIHPKVAEAFEAWQNTTKNTFGVYEAAILFEKGFEKRCAFTILVTAPKELKVKRVQGRSALTQKDILARMENQWPDEKKRDLADYIVDNSGKKSLIEQVNQIIDHINIQHG